MSGTNPFANLSASVSAQLSQAIASGSQSAVTDLFASLNYSENQSRTLLAALGFVQSTIPAPGLSGGLESAYGPRTDGYNIISIEQILQWAQINHPTTTIDELSDLFLFSISGTTPTPDGNTFCCANMINYYDYSPFGKPNLVNWQDFVLFRLTPSGLLDKSFAHNTGGACAISILPKKAPNDTSGPPAPPGLWSTFARYKLFDICRQVKTGKIIVGINAIERPSRLYRIYSNGIIDTSWGDSGRLIIQVYPKGFVIPNEFNDREMSQILDHTDRNGNIFVFVTGMVCYGITAGIPTPAYPPGAQCRFLVTKLDDNGKFVKTFDNGTSGVPGICTYRTLLIDEIFSVDNEKGQNNSAFLSKNSGTNNGREALYSLLRFTEPTVGGRNIAVIKIFLDTGGVDFDWGISNCEPLEDPGWAIIPPVIPGVDGVCTSPISLLELSNGKLLICGITPSVPTNEVRIVRLTNRGKLDTDEKTGFGPIGGPILPCQGPRQGWISFTWTSQGPAIPNSINYAVSQKDGKIILSGFCRTSEVHGSITGFDGILPCTARINEDAELDPTWGYEEGVIISGVNIPNLNKEGVIFLWLPSGPCGAFSTPGCPSAFATSSWGFWDFSGAQGPSSIAVLNNGKVILSTNRLIFMANG